MAICDHCAQEMNTADSCVEDVDPTKISTHHTLSRCPDCKVAPGGTHHPGCDLEKCSVCDGQWICCGHSEHNPALSRWTGEMPGAAECRALGWFCRDLHLDGTLPSKERPMIFGAGNMRWHAPCGPDDEGASPDLNRWFRHLQTRRSLA